jgi:hypothetical protein
MEARVNVQPHEASTFTTLPTQSGASMIYIWVKAQIISRPDAIWADFKSIATVRIFYGLSNCRSGVTNPDTHAIGEI